METFGVGGDVGGAIAEEARATVDDADPRGEGRTVGCPSLMGTPWRETAW